MKPVNPHQIPLVKTLNNCIGKFTIHLRIRTPQSSLLPPIPMNRKRHIIQTIFRILLTLLRRRRMPTLIQRIHTRPTPLRLIRIHTRHIMKNRPQHPFTKPIIHLPKLRRVTPHRHAIKRPQTPLHLPPLLHRHAKLRTQLIIPRRGPPRHKIPVPPAPFHRPDPRHAQMRLHAQQRLVIPIRGPNPVVTAVKVHREERRRDHESVRVGEVHAPLRHAGGGAVVRGGSGGEAHLFLHGGKDRIRTVPLTGSAIQTGEGRHTPSAIVFQRPGTTPRV
mmetsp:Transcript_14678/g.18496  ORF Transcript_14678/g.18496 Transcript_14678/m.18496 type:complete len:276 (-) Transcript_14678:863-1690(-)